MGMTATECNFFAVITFEQQNINKQNKKRGPKFAALITGSTFCSFPRKDLEEPACLRFQGHQEFDGEVERIRQPRRLYSVSEIAHNSAIIPVLNPNIHGGGGRDTWSRYRGNPAANGRARFTSAAGNGNSAGRR
uniref:(northern house mosquito) hypothetical protein n=1 Tax=Culex pipiens TaxID=7175 RepID=A0A8D8AW66_CULPI